MWINIFILDASSVSDSHTLHLQEEFLKDVMHFLTIRGHSRLIPQGGLEEFPDAVLNAKRLDLFNLYKEVRAILFILVFIPSFPCVSLNEYLSESSENFQVVSRGGFHVGNGINWKGQVFSKMSNYTTTHRMTVRLIAWSNNKILVIGPLNLKQISFCLYYCRV